MGRQETAFVRSGLWNVTVPPERPVPQQSALRVDLPRSCPGKAAEDKL